jgi:hypothetical protein
MSNLADFFERNWVLSLLLIVIFGYFLGITISTTVDYRLRDAAIQMPTPKQTIIVNMNSKKTNEFFENGSDETTVSKPGKSKSKKQSKQKEESSDKSASISILDSIDDSPAYENFINKSRINDPAEDEFITSSSYASASHKDIPDTAQRAYAMSYRIADSLSKFPFPFKAYNADENAQQFSKFVSK